MFSNLFLAWRHANITRQREVLLFKACVVSKLLYSLEAICIRKAEQSRIDGFQAQALRKIFEIPQPMLSLISNEEVRRIANEKPLTQTVLYRQLTLFGKIARASDDDSDLCQASFQPASNVLRQLDGKRKVGRPRLR